MEFLKGFKAILWLIVIIPLVFVINLYVVEQMINLFFESTGTNAWIYILAKLGSYIIYLTLIGVIPYLIVTRDD